MLLNHQKKYTVLLLLLRVVLRRVTVWRMKNENKGFVERISLVFPKALLEEVDRRAKAEGRTRSGQIRFFLRNVVRRSKTIIEKRP